MSFFRSEEKQLELETKKQELLKEKIKRKQDKLKEKNELREQKEKTRQIHSLLNMRHPLDYKALVRRTIKKSKRLLVHMELDTGMHTQFIARVINNSFMYEKRSYVVDDELKYYDIASKMFASDYHQSLSIPVKRKIPLTELKKLVTVEGVTDVETAINPLTLKQFIESEVIQKVMKGADLDKVFQFMKMILIYIAIVLTVLFLLFLQVSGVLSGLRVPGLGG